MRLSLTPLVEPLLSRPATQEELLDFRISYDHLLTFYAAGKAHGLMPRNTPVRYRQLESLGVGKEVLQWMLYQGHVDHLGASSGDGAGWSPKRSVVVADGSAFALTALGEAFAELLVAAPSMLSDHGELPWGWGPLRVGLLAPRFNEGERLLVWGRHELKRFRQPSAAQEMIWRRHRSRAGRPGSTTRCPV